MSGLRISLRDLKSSESQFSSHARKQLEQKLLAIEVETNKKKKAEAKTKSPSSKNTIAKAKMPATESPAQANLRHLLQSDPLHHAYKDQWVEDYKGASPTSRYEVDFALPELKIGIEVDGWQYHGKHKEAFLRDRQKDFEIKTNGWVLLRLQAGILLNYRKLNEPSQRIQAFLNCWVPRQQLLAQHFKEFPNAV